MALVYKAINSVTGQTYIGMTTKPLAKRLHGHRSASRRDVPTTLFAQAMKKYGFESFSFEVLIDGLTTEQAIKEEIRLIDELFPDYNLTPGGEGPNGYKWTDERRRQHAMLQRTPEWRQRISEGLRGRKLSATAIENMKKASKAKLHKPVMCLTDCLWFPSIKHAAIHYGIAKTQIGTVCNGFEATAHGKHFVRSSTKLTEEDCRSLIREIDLRVMQNFAKASQARRRAVICLTDGKAYQSVIAAAKAYGLSQMTVVQSCQRATDLTTGLSFMYADADAPPVKRQKSQDEIERAAKLRDEALARGVQKNKKRVKCLNDGRVYSSITAAAREYGLGISLLSRSIHTKTRAKGRRFAFVEASP